MVTFHNRVPWVLLCFYRIGVTTCEWLYSLPHTPAMYDSWDKKFVALRGEGETEGQKIV